MPWDTPLPPAPPQMKKVRRVWIIIEREDIVDGERKVTELYRYQKALAELCPEIMAEHINKYVKLGKELEAEEDSRLIWRREIQEEVVLSDNAARGDRSGVGVRKVIQTG